MFSIKCELFVKMTNLRRQINRIVKIRAFVSKPAFDTSSPKLSWMLLISGVE